MKILEGFLSFLKRFETKTKSVNDHVNQIIKLYKNNGDNFIYDGISKEYIREVGEREVGDENINLISSLQIKADEVVSILRNRGYEVYRIPADESKYRVKSVENFFVGPEVYGLHIQVDNDQKLLDLAN